jgi:hypothetical protein
MNQPSQPNTIGRALAKVEPLLRTTWVRSRPTLLATLKSLLSLGQEAATALETQIAAEASSPDPLNFTPMQKAATTFWEKVQPWWVKIIAGVRSRLDGETNEKLSDRAISGIFSGLALLLLWLTTSLPMGQSQPASTGTKAPINAPAKPAVKLAPKSVAQTYPADVTNKTVFPKDLTPVPIKPVAPKAVAAPKPLNKPTPEQQLLTSFQGLSNGYAPNLIQTAQQDKLANSLRLTLGDGWYGLEPDQQDKLATELLSKTQTLKVRSLQLLDKQGNLLARNPIVGNEMVVLLRQLAGE